MSIEDSENRQGARIRRIGLWLRAAQLLWILVIWGLSLFSGAVSSSHSGWVMALIRPLTDWLGIVDPARLIRKTGHFVEYAILGMLTAGAGFDQGAARRIIFSSTGRKVLPVFLPGLPTAIVDEQIVQRFLAFERGPSWADVGLDWAGYLAGYGLVRGFGLLRQRCRQSRSNKNASGSNSSIV